MKDYIRSRFLLLALIAAVWLGTMIYVTYLTYVNIPLADLMYLNVLLALLCASFITVDYCRLRKRMRLCHELIQSSQYINSDELPYTSMKEVFAHNEECYEKEMEDAYEKGKELQEYIARWSHEIKLPLSALRMMNERNRDLELRKSMQEQCEKMEQLLHTMLSGCKTWDASYDKTIQKISIAEVVTTSIRHQSYFLIREHFEIEQKVTGIYVLSDPQWLVYLLDQIIQNAVKYHGEICRLSIWAEQDGTKTTLHIKDYGVGIRKQDLPSVFDKGYTGENMRNGEYKSTGMGLYFVNRIIHLLGHQITIDSKEHSYTDVQITFDHHLDYFNLTDL